MTQPSEPVTLVQVAREAGVSTSSASVALRGEPGVSQATRDRVLRIARRLGYRADRHARLLRESRTRVIGVTFDPDHAYHAELLDPLYQCAESNRHELLLSAATRRRGHREAAEDLLRDDVSALILLGPDLQRAELSELGARTAVVSIGTTLRPPRVDEIHADDVVGIRLAVSHLTSLGHRRITFVDGGASTSASSRREAYRAAMTESGLETRIAITPSAPSEEAGVTTAVRLLDSGEPLPTALVAHSDSIAIGLLIALRARGVDVPGQVSVVGYDETRLASLGGIALTTVSQDPAMQAGAAVAQAMDRIAHPRDEGRLTVIQPKLVLRLTTSVPRLG